MTDETISKKIEAYLVVNWKTKAVEVFKRQPKNLGTFEIPLHLDITLKIPQQKVSKITGEIEIPVAKAEDMVVDSI